MAILEGLLRFAHVHNRLILLFTILLSHSDSMNSSESDLDDLTPCFIVLCVHMHNFDAVFTGVFITFFVINVQVEGAGVQ